MTREKSKALWVMNAICLFILIILYNQDIRAETRVHLGANSWHYTSGDTTNSEHNLVAFEYLSYTAGYFKNSYDHDTLFVSRTWRTPVGKYLEFNYSLGFNYGYHGCYSGTGTSQTLCPHGHLGLTYTKYNLMPSLKIFGTALVITTEIKL